MNGNPAVRLLARAVWIPATLIFGLAPSVVFFMWVEALGRIPPGFAALFSWVLGAPVIDLGGAPLAARIACDVGLLFGFGLIHTGLAQLSVHERLAQLVGAPQVRALYVIVTGFTLAVVVASWQYLGGRVWQLGPGTTRELMVTQVLYWLLVLGTGLSIAGHGAIEFLGFAPVWRGTVGARTAGTDRLVTTGFYARVRHPGYMFLLAAFLCASAMTYDRFVVFATTASYLVLVGIPLEERKLIAIHGADYESYRRRVPMLIPLFRRF